MKPVRAMPPRIVLRFFRWYCDPRLADAIEGDLLELYGDRLRKYGKWKADIQFTIEVLLLFRRNIVRPLHGYEKNGNTYSMYKSYLKIGWRNLLKEKGYSFVNIGGLACGLAVTILIGLWAYDEYSTDRHQENYHNVAAVLQHNVVDGNIETMANQSYQLGQELRNDYGNYFRRVVMSFSANAILRHEEKAMGAAGSFMEVDAPELLDLRMVHGTRASFAAPASILVSATTAGRFFGPGNPVGKILSIDNETNLTVAGVYEDVPRNSSFNGTLDFIAPLQVVVDRGGRNFGWVNNWLLVFVELNDRVDMQAASAAIRDVKIRNVDENDKRFKPELFLHPMSKWHLYADFENGVNVGGRIDYVWTFVSIGVFVLLLASINFMNLSTARSQKRSREVGVRKVIGSARGHLIRQFFTESLQVVALAFVFAIVLVELSLPWFNEVAGKAIKVNWLDARLWLLLGAFVILTSIVSGSYPAFYLSAFKPVDVLKGTLRSGRRASLPRKFFVVVQFTVSVVLAIGTLVVYRQIDFATSRPVGYELNGLVTVPIRTEEVKKNYGAFRNSLLSSGLFSEVSASETTVTNMWWSDWGFSWKGKDPNRQDHIYRGAIDYDFGKTVGWKIKEGRDFSRDYPADSASVILNEAAVKYMGFDDPVGETIRGYGRDYTVIGVVEDMMTQSLYEPAKQTIFVLDPFDRASYIHAKINGKFSASEALEGLHDIFVSHHPGTPFEYTFADEEFAAKFNFESRVGNLAAAFSGLAILISLLGLFGLASYVAEQRTKEIGIRKVLGASVSRLWLMLSKDFVVLVVVSCVIAVPAAYFFASDWLANYTYRTPLEGWIFFVTCLTALLATLATVSFQAVKAALMNPVESLKSE